MYAVVDLETTGRKTSWHDRVVEIAVVRLGESGQTLDEWCTLVNPDRDLGPQEKKARQYGVPIVHPTAYQAMLDTLLAGSAPVSP